MQRGDGSAIASDFITRFTNYLFQSIKNFGDNYSWTDMPFHSKERALYSHVGAAISNITHVHMSEIPISGCDDNPRRVDFWCYYRHAHIGIEIKKAWVNIKSTQADVLNKDFIESWHEMINQTNDVYHHMRGEWRGEHEKVISIGVMAFAAYSGRRSHQESYEYDLWKKIITDHISELDPDHVNFIITIDLAEWGGNTVHTFGGRDEFIPLIGLAGYIKNA